jgi:hypothetical protein
VSGRVSLKASPYLGVGLLLGASAGEVAMGGFVAVDHAPVHDGMEGVVESAVFEAVEAVAGDASGGCFDRADAGEGSEGGIGSAPARMGLGHDEVCGAHRTGLPEPVSAHSASVYGDATDQPVRHGVRA